MSTDNSDPSTSPSGFPMASSFVPPFSLDKPKYDQSNMSGRIRHFFEVFNPMLLLTTDKELETSLNLIDQFKRKQLRPVTPEMNEKLWHARMIKESIIHPQTNEKLWHARMIKESIIHPQTNEKLPLLFRFSSFVPVNIPIVVGMLTSTTPAGQMFWQWFNQSYNVCVNYSNGNKSHPLPPAQMLGAYSGAVGVSCGLAWYLGKVAKRATHLPPVAASLASVFVPYTAVAIAGACNALMMRYNEMTDGIYVYDEEGHQVGISKLAGRQALMQVAITRMVLPGPIIILPGLIMKGLSKVPAIKSRPRLAMPLNISAIALCLWAALPCAIGLFPQTASAPTSQLEKEFHKLRRPDGTTIDRVYFNKGL
eukprot:662204_1